MSATLHHDLVCPGCGADLRSGSAELQCLRCGLAYPVVQGVPMLLPGLRITPGPAPDPGFVEDIARVAAPDAPDQARAAMHDLFSTRFHFPERQLGTEGHRFLHRLRSSGFAIRDAHPTAPAPEPPAATGSVALTLATAPDSVRAGQPFWVQLRIANNSASVLRATGADAAMLSCSVEPPSRWRGLWRRVAEAPPSRLLVDLPPGQALTQPVHITAAARTGPVTYRIALAGVADLDVSVVGVPASAPDPLTVEWPYSPIVRDYGSDHARGIELMRGWLHERLGRLTAPRMLELGGNASPLLQRDAVGLGSARLFNLDIDPFGLVFGTVQRRISGERPIQDVLADGMRLPFPDASLSAIVMFATLHHFPDPAALLRHLAVKLAPGGLICACCEPVGHVTHEALPADFREELLNGICEQAFEPWEWRSLFDRAGLAIAHVQHDRGSLKVALERL